MARGDPIVARSRDPAEPVDALKPSHVLARLREERVGSAIVALLDVNRDFDALSPASVNDEEPVRRDNHGYLGCCW